ncbi:hypothetical protein BDV29DRAFT_37440 [Aspergillus leporis]|jgi:hypothetical protein|uniref:Prenylated rab acceptor 1 n=1 Tax=Aspergillus leporis TaxID=41062 RepID=A0A5N5WR50_9EURO|nr:hypothetical protein BDV29DRAFT_37440 [Aspergillus leporis]
MPRWGRPPGAQLRRQTRRRAAPWADGDARIEEIDSEEEYLLQDGRGLYARQLAGMDIDGNPGWRRRMPEYDEFSDEDGSVDGLDYDLHDDEDSTVAYAVHLAMKDKEDLLVEDALGRIRHAQMSGQKNVRLSKRELEALERKRVQASGRRDSERRKPTSKASRSSSTPGAQRRGSSIAQSGQAPYQLADSSWARGSGCQSRRPQQSGSSLSSSSPRTTIRYSKHYTTMPQQASLRGTPFARPLPDDSNRVSPYQPLHGTQPSVDPLRGSSRRLLSYLSGYQSGSSRPNSARSSFVPRSAPSKSGAEGLQYNDGGEEGGSGDSDRVHLVDGVERKVPASPSSRITTDKESRRLRTRR